MKKLYIQPEVEFELLEMSCVMQDTSWTTKPNDSIDPNKKDPTDPNGNLTGGNLFGDAKEGSLDFSDDFDFQLDL